jgi:hypothetical protein
MQAVFERAFAGPAAFWDSESEERYVTETQAAGELELTTGRLAIHDPAFGFVPDPLDRDAPPGAHGVDLVLRSWTADGGTVTPRAMIAAVRVRLRPGRPERFEPVQSALRNARLDIGVDSGLVSIFDRGLLPEIAGAPIIDAILGCAPEGTPGNPTAHVAPAPGGGSLFTCQAGMGDGSYRAWWGLDGDDDAVELIVDFGLLSHSLWRTVEIPAAALLGSGARLRLALLGTGVELEPVSFDSIRIPFPGASEATVAVFRRPAGPLWEFKLYEANGTLVGGPGHGQVVPGPWFEVFGRALIERAATLRIQIHEGNAPDEPLDD